MNALWAVVHRGVAGAWRNRWTFLIPVATLLLPATIYALRLPDEYEAKAVVQIRPLMPESIDRALPQEATARADEVMATVRDRIFTRDNLRTVQPLLAPLASPDDTRALETMSLAYSWEQVGASTFTVSLTKPDPEVAAEGVNRLLEAFLEAEREDRLQRAVRNQTFHESELAQAEQEYAAVRERLSAFRTEHEETLPDRKDAIQAELSRLQTEITAQVAAAATIRARIQGLDERLIGLATQPVPTTGSRISATEEMLSLQLVEENRSLNALQQALAEALAKYTDKHPDVVRLRSAVTVHRQAVAETTERLDRERREARRTVEDSGESQLARARQNVEAMRHSAEDALASADDSRRAYQQRVDVLQGLLGEIPTTKAALEPILVELEQASTRRKAREGAAIDARAAAEFYRSRDVAAVTGFRISSPAVPPVRATGPGRWKWLLSAVLVGLLVGYGLLVLRHRHEGATIHRGEDLRDLFPSAVIVSIPLLGPTRARTWASRIKEVGLAVYVVVLLGASAWALAAHKGLLAKPDWWSGVFGGGA